MEEGMGKQMEKQIGNLQDCWSILYIKLARALVDAVPVEGEAAVREAIRRFGRDRGEKLRMRHAGCGLKINLENLFTYYDLPGDPRFKRRKIRLNPQERLSDTLVCPIAQLWKEAGEKELGRVYCEEFHHAMFGSYAKKAQIDLAKTLTQEGDDYCCFAVYLRPANMDREERKEAFAEFDPEYRFPADFIYDEGTHRNGFNMLCIKLGYYLVQQAVESLGEAGKKAAAKGLNETAEAFAQFMKAGSCDAGQELNETFLKENCPLSADMSADKLWKEYNSKEVAELFNKEFYNRFSVLLNMEVTVQP